MLGKRFEVENEKEIQKLWEEEKAFKFNGIYFHLRNQKC